jgi:hypothetical protein
MGAYAPSTREVLIPVGDNVTETTLIHELTHAAVDKRMHTPSGEMTRQQNMARETLGDIYNTIAQTIEIAPDTFMGISRYDALKDHNGVSSVHEFIAEVRSNPAFRTLLQEIPLANGKGQDSRFHLWDVFVKAIRDLLGLDTKNATVLEAADKMIPMMFLPPEARFGKALPRKMDVGLWAKYGERAEKANATSWSRQNSERITQAQTTASRARTRSWTRWRPRAPRQNSAQRWSLCVKTSSCGTSTGRRACCPRLCSTQ